MKRCLACQSFVDVHMQDSLPWCGPCIADGVADVYAHRVDWFLDAALDAEVLRRVNDAKIGTAG